MTHHFSTSTAALAALGLLLATATCKSRSEPAPSGVTATVAKTAKAEAPAKPLQPDPELRTGTFPGGIRYLLRPLRNGDPTLRLAVVVRAGSYVEEEAERGVAHFVEHVVLDGAQRFAGVSSMEVLQSQGLLLGADISAVTDFTHARYALPLRSEQLELGLPLLSGWVSRAQFAADIVERQRAVVLAELNRSQDSPRAEALEQAMAGHRLARRAPLGVSEMLKTVPASALQSFYERWYRPENLVVTAVGDFDPAALEQALARHFSNLSSEVRGTARGVPEAVPPEPPLTGKAWRLARTEVEPSSVWRAQVRTGGSPLHTEADYRERLADDLVCLLLRHRLSQPAASAAFDGQVSCGLSRSAAGVRVLELGARARSGALDKSVLALERMVAETIRFGLQPADRELAQAELLQTLRRQAERSLDATVLQDRLLATATFGDVFLSPAQQVELAQQLLPQIELDELQQHAHTWLSSRAFLLATEGFGKPSVADDAALAQLLDEADAAARTTAPAPASPARALTLPAPPAPGVIAHAEPLSELGVTRWTLGNGAIVLYKQLPAYQHEARLAAVEPRASGANDLERMAAQGLLNQARSLIPKCGAGEHGADELSRLLAGNTAKIAFGVEGLQAEAALDDVETMLQLLHLHVTAPRRDTACIEQTLSARTGAQAPVAAAAPSNDPRQLADALFQAFSAHFGNIGGFTFVLAAALPAERARALVERYVASLPGTAAARGEGAPSGTPMVRGGPKAGKWRVTPPYLGSVNSLVTLRFEGNVEPSLEARVDLLTLAEYLRQGLLEALREQLGLTYTAIADLSWKTGSYSLDLKLQCLPSDVPRLQQATARVIGQLDQPGISERHLALLRAAWERGLPAPRESADFWIDELLYAQRESADPQRILELTKVSKSLSRERIKAAALRYLQLPP